MGVAMIKQLILKDWHEFIEALRECKADGEHGLAALLIFTVLLMGSVIIAVVLVCYIFMPIVSLVVSLVILVIYHFYQKL